MGPDPQRPIGAGGEATPAPPPAGLLADAGTPVETSEGADHDAAPPERPADGRAIPTDQAFEPGRGPELRETRQIAGPSHPDRGDFARQLEVADRNFGLLLGLGLVVFVFAVDFALGPGNQVLGLAACPAFVTAIFSGARRTAIVAAFALVVSFAWGLNAGNGLAAAQLVRLAGIAVAGLGATATAAVRVQRDERLVRLSRIAELAQLAVLRVIPERVGTLDVGIRFVSATALAQVGGDFYEVLPYDGGVRAVLGDVRGKGVGSVRLASVLVGAFRAADHDAWDLPAVLRSMDQAFRRIEPADEDFATALLFDITDDGRMTLLNCGHPAPLLLTDGEVRELAPAHASLPIGLGPTPEQVVVDLQPDDRVLAFTDGLTEARQGERSFDLLASAQHLLGGSIQHAVDHLRVDLVRFLEGHLDDDTTLVLVQRAAESRAPTTSR